MAKAKKPSEVEYRLMVAPHLNERRQIRTTLLTIETTKTFASFRYELSVMERWEGKSLHLKIAGLKAPQLSLPASGTAQFVREYDNLKGKHDITIENMDGTENTFTINVTTKRIDALKVPKNPFIQLVLP
jgi:hypothetical protein